MAEQEATSAEGGPAAVRPVKKNAFERLMTRKPEQPPEKGSGTGSKPRNPYKTSLPSYYGRDALGAYIAAPASFPPSVVISHDDDFVLIRDKFPKSDVHLLLLPRDREKSSLHPFDALADAVFRDKILERIDAAKKLVAAELRRLHGLGSVAEQARNAAMQRGDAELPPGRDWDKEVVAGVHAVPSMSHLHIHIISVDRHSDSLKHRKHYNSFATKFFVPVSDLPLQELDERRHPTRAGYLAQDLVCWRCGQNFGHRFASLKQHLQEEWQEWRRL